MVAVLIAAALAQAAPAPVPAPSAAALPPPLLSLKQLTLPTGTGPVDAAKQARIEAFRAVTRGIAGCDGVDAVATAQGASVVENNAVPITALPKPLADLLAVLPIGKATPLFGDPANGQVRVLVLCARG